MTEEKLPSVCAVVVTCNRKALLQECIEALFNQTHKVDRIAVVDNAGSDGSGDMVTRLFPEVFQLRLRENVGGAGGFHLGTQWAFDHGFDWLWLMDDDTIASPSALAELFLAREGFDPPKQPSLLASKVVWTDGSLHFMNQPRVNITDLENLSLSVERATLAIRSTTFVSCLVHRSLVERYGLPIAGYFIWGDDVEYTARVLRENFGVMVPKSIVLHKTQNKHTALDAAPERYFYHVRNTIWMLTRSDAWTGKEKLRNWITLAAWIGRYFRGTGFRLSTWKAVLRGARAGIFSAPHERNLHSLIVGGESRAQPAGRSRNS